MLAAASGLALAYSLSRVQEQATRVQLANHAAYFDTPSEAAYAASLRYAQAMPFGEIGSKIYLDVVGNRAYYSYGSQLISQTDPSDGADEIVYDSAAADGHTAVVGMWHEHPLSDTWSSLYGHNAEITQTHQTIWTTIGLDFYVQYWDGTGVAPRWSNSIPAIDPICRDCA